MKCATLHCLNKAAKGRRICHKCKNARYKHNNPEHYAYNSLKYNAKRRNVPCTLTFEDFKEFCYKYDYMIGKGKSKESYTIDRIDNTKGYVKDNIQMLTLSENARKGKKVLKVHYCDIKGKLVAKVLSPADIKSYHDDDVPF